MFTPFLIPPPTTARMSCFPQTTVTYGDFVDIYNALVDRIKLRAVMSSTLAAPARLAGAARVAAGALRSAGPSVDVGLCNDPYGGDSVPPSATLPPSRPIGRRNGSGSAYLVSGAALKGINGVYTQSGDSDGVPKYTYTGLGGVQYCLQRRSMPGGRYWFICEVGAHSIVAAVASPAAPRSFFCLRSNAGTPPLEVPWERSRDGLLPGPFLTPISLTHAPPTSVLAPLARCIEPPCCVRISHVFYPFPTFPLCSLSPELLSACALDHDCAVRSFEVGDFVRANWAGRGVLYPGEVLAINHEDDTVDVLYDDGDFESHVPRERVHAVSIELTDSFHAFGVGDVVKADLKGHGSWYTGRIISIDTKFRVSNFPTGVSMGFCSACRCRWFRRCRVSAPCHSFHSNAPGSQSPSRQVTSHYARLVTMQVFTIKYENGHLEKHVPPSRVQPLSTGHIKYFAPRNTAFVFCFHSSPPFSPDVAARSHSLQILYHLDR